MTLKKEDLTQAQRAAAQETITVAVAKLMENFENVNFNRKTINRVVIKFKNLVQRMSQLQAKSAE